MFIVLTVPKPNYGMGQPGAKVQKKATHHISTYWRVINQTNKWLNKICSMLLPWQIFMIILVGLELRTLRRLGVPDRMWKFQESQPVPCLWTLACGPLLLSIPSLALSHTAGGLTYMYRHLSPQKLPLAQPSGLGPCTPREAHRPLRKRKGEGKRPVQAFGSKLREFGWGIWGS